MDRLPPELAPMIAADLDIISVCSLRLVSRLIGNQFTSIFLKHLRVQRADLSKPGLQRLYELASNPVLGTVVSTLTLTCLYYHKDPWSNDKCPSALPPLIRTLPTAVPDGSSGRSNQREWIAERRAEQTRFAGEDAISVLADSLRDMKNLRHLRLEASVVRDVDLRQAPEDVPSLRWRELWTSTIQAYRILLVSIARAGIQLDSISIYDSTKKCSIPTHEVFEPLSLFSSFEWKNFAAFADHLKSFSISLATTTLPVRPRLGVCGTLEKAIDLDPYGQFDISRGHNLHASDRQVDALSDMAGVARLFHMMPNLESLHIHLCTTVNGLLSPTYYQNLLATLFAGGWRFFNLSHLRLRGLRVSQDDLQDILARHVPQLCTLGLENITLSSGSWEVIFSLLHHEAKLLEKLRLSVLWSPEFYGNRLNLAPVHRTLYAGDSDAELDWEEAVDGEHIWYSREITGEEVRRPKGLEFRPMMLSSGNPAKARWYKEHRIEYGPL